MNLDYEINNNRFNSRVSAIIYNQDKSKVLLFKIKGRDYFMLPGGRIEFNEDSKSAIKREILEEIGCELEFQLCSIQENFLMRDNVNIMQYCFCYKALYNENIDELEFICKDNDDQIFRWVDVENIDTIKIVPYSSKELIVDNTNLIKHIVEKNEKC